jgi:lipoprotein signal peptidase
MNAYLRRLFSNPKFLILLTLVFVSVTIATDQILKARASELLFPLEFLCFRVFPFGNHGIFGGYLADLDPWVIRIFFSVLFGFLAIGIALAMYFLRPKKAPMLKVGLLVYVAGIFGNVWDRMTTGSVVDYVEIRIPGLSGMAFNFADAVVFMGAVFIAVAIFREADELWYGI